MSGTNERGAVGDGLRGDEAARLPSLEEQTPGLDTDVVDQTDADAQAFFGKGGEVTTGAVGDGLRGDEAARLPSLEEQTPGLDEKTVERTEADAKAFFGGEAGGSGSQGGQG